MNNINERCFMSVTGPNDNNIIQDQNIIGESISSSGIKKNEWLGRVASHIPERHIDTILKKLESSNEPQSFIKNASQEDKEFLNFLKTTKKSSNADVNEKIKFTNELINAKGNDSAQNKENLSSRFNQIVGGGEESGLVQAASKILGHSPEVKVEGEDEIEEDGFEVVDKQEVEGLEDAEWEDGSSSQ